MNEHESLRLCQAIIVQSPDAVLFSDLDGIIRLWNGAATRLFGYAAHEAIGASLDLIIPERLRARHWHGYRQVMASGESSYGTKLLAVPALHRDGGERSVEFSIVLVRDAAGAVSGVASIMRDVSERFQKEKALRAGLAARRDKESAG